MHEERPRMFEDELTALLREEWAYLRKSQFDLIWNIPSSDARFFARHVCALSEDDTQLLISDMMVRSMAELAHPEKQPDAQYTNPPLLQQFYKLGLDHMFDWSNLGLRQKREEANAFRKGAALRPLSDAELEDADSLTPATAAQIRKCINSHIGELYPGKVISLGGGVWEYQKTSSGVLCRVSFDYKAKGSQVRYNVVYGKGHQRWPGIGVSYERMMGISFGGLDQLSVERLEESIRAVIQLIERTERVLCPVVKYIDHLHNQAL